MNAVRVYQYISPAVLTPLSFYLWWAVYHNYGMIFIAWLIPILWAYILPGIGTNIFRLWEFDVKFKLGKFRPHHGFVFGSATSVFAWLARLGPITTWGAVFQYTLILTSVIGFWNLLYEVKALKSGVLKVYNQPWAEGKGEEAVAMDYSPWIFGGFGAAYGFVLSVAEYYHATTGGMTGVSSSLFIISGVVLTLILPVAGFMQSSYRRHGHYGVKPQGKAVK